MTAPPHRPVLAAAVFLAVTFTITWGTYFAASASGLADLLAWVGGIGPTVGAIVAGVLVMKRRFPGFDLDPRVQRPRLYLWAIAIPVVIAFTADGVVAASFEISGNRQWLPPNVLAGLQTLVLFAFLEEIGWRGMLYPCLLSRGTGIAGLATGFVWGIWHLPWALADWHMSIPAFALYTCIAMVASISLGVLTTRSRSIWPAALGHTTWNYVVLSGVLVTGESYGWVGQLLTLAGFSMVAIVALKFDRQPKPVTRHMPVHLRWATAAICVVGICLLAL